MQARYSWFFIIIGETTKVSTQTTKEAGETTKVSAQTTKEAVQTTKLSPQTTKQQTLLGVLPRFRKLFEKGKEADAGAAPVETKPVEVPT